MECFFPSLCLIFCRSFSIDSDIRIYKQIHVEVLLSESYCHTPFLYKISVGRYFSPQKHFVVRNPFSSPLIGIALLCWSLLGFRFFVGGFFRYTFNLLRLLFSFRCSVDTQQFYKLNIINISKPPRYKNPLPDPFIFLEKI